METGQQRAKEDDTPHCVCAMGVHCATDGCGRWSICNVLWHAVCSDDHCTIVQRIGGSWDEQRGELAHSQCKDGDDCGVQIVWISTQIGVLMCDGEGIDAQ